ncbi:DUF411 domain-containing protein [Comamonas serinivorans]|nr:DUF411 domain-containing protein [Comamonas serinivorans]
MMTPPTSRRRWLTLTLGGLAALTSALGQANTDTTRTAMTVWKDPNCGCCQDWVDRMAQAGFAITVHDTGNSAMRARLGLPSRLGSCHTALVGGYVVEGHVPAADIRRLLKERPRALGLAVPGMPVGSPGMDGPAYGDRRDPYDVLLVTRPAPGQDVTTRVFSSHR